MVMMIFLFFLLIISIAVTHSDEKDLNDINDQYYALGQSGSQPCYMSYSICRRQVSSDRYRPEWNVVLVNRRFTFYPNRQIILNQKLSTPSEIQVKGKQSHSLSQLSASKATEYDAIQTKRRKLIVFALSQILPILSGLIGLILYSKYKESEELRYRTILTESVTEDKKFNLIHSEFKTIFNSKNTQFFLLTHKENVCALVPVEKRKSENKNSSEKSVVVVNSSRTTFFGQIKYKLNQILEDLKRIKDDINKVENSILDKIDLNIPHWVAMNSNHISNLILINLKKRYCIEVIGTAESQTDSNGNRFWNLIPHSVRFTLKGEDGGSMETTINNSSLDKKA